MICENETVAVIFGTRPEYLKLKPLIDKFKEININHKVVYVQQHNNIDETLDKTYDILQIEENSGHRLCSIGEQILNKLPAFIDSCKYVIVQGDTATAYYSAVVSFQLKKKIIHVEAGLRTYDLEKPFPEEAYRQMISRISDINFTPHDDSSKLLMNEKVSGKIYTVGNTILDLISSYQLKCTFSDTVLITFHRRENWDKIDILLTGLKNLIKQTPHLKYIWYLHPNPDLQNKVRESIKYIPSIELCSPCSHKEFTEKMAKSNFLITDSGGVQEEASFLGKHCIVLRASTERSHIPKEYITILEDYSKLSEVYHTIPTGKLPPCNVYGYGNSASTIIELLIGSKNNNNNVFLTISCYKTTGVTSNFYIKNKNTGLGNMLFQISSAISYSVKNKANLYVPCLDTYFQAEELNKNDSMFRKIKTKKIETFNESNMIYTGSKSDYYIFDQPFYNNIHISGYFENIENFDNIRTTIVEYFSPSENNIKYLLDKYPFIKDDCIASIHVRLGTCITNHYSKEQIVFIENTYFEMIDYMIQNKGVTKFMVLTNDKEYCKTIFNNNEKYKDVEFFYSNEERDFMDLWIMSLMKNNIISFSTFSFWGSYLNTNKDQFVVGSSKTVKDKLKYKNWIYI